MNTEKNTEAFLTDISARDLQQFLTHSYVFPKEDVSVRLANEIAAKSGCNSTPLSPDSSEFHLFLSAWPEKFVSETIKAMTEVVRRLKHENAKTFDLMFVNPAQVSDPTHHWGDQVLVRVRFTT